MGYKNIISFRKEIKMSKANWITIPARLKKGYHVASGPSKAYPEYGSIEKQKPFFKKLGLNLDRMFNGTLNISIEPYEYTIKVQAQFLEIRFLLFDASVFRIGFGWTGRDMVSFFEAGREGDPVDFRHFCFSLKAIICLQPTRPQTFVCL